MSQNSQTHFKSLAALASRFGTLCIKGLKVYKAVSLILNRFFSISITNFLKYIFDETPVLPEILSINKVNLEFPDEGLPYVFVETKERLHKFCPRSVNDIHYI